jgi:hypothetical protein
VNSSPQLPIIDIGAFSQGTQQRAATTQAVTDALTQSGFMYITGHDIDGVLIERAFAAMRWFFGQPREFKVRYAYSDIDANFGYQRIETERLDPGSMPDLKESFTMRNALERADETARWPEGEFCDVALALYAAGLGAAYRVMEVLAAGTCRRFFLRGVTAARTSRCAFCTTPLDCCRVRAPNSARARTPTTVRSRCCSRMKSAASSCSARTAPGRRRPPCRAPR